MLRRKILSSSNLWLFKSETIFSQNIISERKNYCYGFMPGDFQIICGSMVGENRRSPASTETPAQIVSRLAVEITIMHIFCILSSKHLKIKEK